MRIRNFFLFLLLMTAAMPANSQIQKQANGREHNRFRQEADTAKKVTVRFNFLGVGDPYDENASFGGEYRFAPQWSAGSDGAYIFSSKYISNAEKTSGFILRPFVRYYPNKRKGFLEVQLHYKYASYQITDWLGKDVNNGQAAYEEYTSFQFRKKAWGVHLIGGSSANLTENKRLRMEFYIGLGVRYKKQYVPHGIYLHQNGTFVELYNPHYNTVVLPIGVRLVYDLKTF